MAPECLNSSINVNSIEDFKKADIYGYALVIWECLNRLKLDSDFRKTTLHSPPYFEYVQGDPDLSIMKELVCDKNIRPVTRFKEDEIEEVSCL